MDTAFEIVARVARLLDELGVRYAVVGSVASSLYGDARATHDVDILAELREGHAARFVSGLERDFYVDGLAARRAILSRRSFNLIHFDSLFKVDLYVAGDDDFTQVQLERRRAEPLLHGSGETIYLVSPEDTLLAKLRWYQRGGEVAARQWSDVTGILKVQGPRLDEAYMREWADKLGVRELLNQLLGGAG